MFDSFYILSSNCNNNLKVLVKESFQIKRDKTILNRTKKSFLPYLFGLEFIV